MDTVQFSRRWIRGYSYREVDEFLDRVKVALRTTEGLGAGSDANAGASDTLTAREVLDWQFSASVPGYDMREVDYFSDELASYLKEKEDGIDS